MILEHPDITHAMRTGYPAWISPENEDTPENRMAYVDEFEREFLNWLRYAYPDITDEFIQRSGRLCPVSYADWLN